jgi:hypothetical protein
MITGKFKRDPIDHSTDLDLYYGKGMKKTKVGEMHDDIVTLNDDAPPEAIALFILSPGEA